MDREEDVFVYNGVDEVPQNVTHVRVDPSVTIIPVRAFYERGSLEEVELPEGLIRIEDDAFHDCTSLETINLPSTVVEIYADSFRDCKNLERIVLPQGLEILGRSAFKRCKSLQTINIPSNVKTIEEGAFYGCESLTNVSFSEGLLEIGKDAFTICESLVSVKLPSSLKVIDEMAFEYCFKLNEICMQDNVETIRSRAFNDCKLVSFRMPPLVKNVDMDDIGEINCLVSLELSENVTRIGDSINDEEEEVLERKSIRNIALPPECIVMLGDMWSWYKDLKVAFPNADNEVDGNNDGTISKALKQRFDDLPIHKICYYRSYQDNETTMQNLKREINPWTSNPPGQLNITGKEKDCLGMTPLHILACSTKPTIEMYRLLIEKYPQTLIMKDKWGDVPLLYAIWCSTPSEVIDLLVESYKTLHSDFIFDWGGMLLTMAKRNAPLTNIQRLVNTQQNSFPHQECDMQVIVMELATYDTSQASFDKPFTSVDLVQYLLQISISKRLDSLCNSRWLVDLENCIKSFSDTTHGAKKRDRDTQAVYDRLATYESIKEGTAVLELAIWKAKIDEGRNKRARVDCQVSYKEQCRVNCGADIVMRNVLPYLMPK